MTIKKIIPEDELLQPATLVVRVSPYKHSKDSETNSKKLLTIIFKLKFQATQSDNRDRYALATLAVSRPGTSLKELQFLQSHYIAGVLENVPLNSVLLTVITNRHRDKVGDIYIMKNCKYPNVTIKYLPGIPFDLINVEKCFNECHFSFISLEFMCPF